jgi:hypothetical protein
MKPATSIKCLLKSGSLALARKYSVFERLSHSGYTIYITLYNVKCYFNGTPYIPMPEGRGLTALF